MKISNVLDSATDRRKFLGRVLGVATAMIAGFKGTAFAVPFCCPGEGWVNSCVYEGDVCYSWDICCYSGVRIWCTRYWDATPTGCNPPGSIFCKDAQSDGSMCGEG